MNRHWQARLLVALASVLWSLSGLFITLLTKPNTWLGDTPPVAAEQIACWRCLFGAASLFVLFRPRMLRWHALLPLMAACFAMMNGLFVLAMSLGDVAEAALLQYTAPFWVLIVTVIVLRKAQATRRDWWALGIAIMGILVVVLGRFQANHAYAAGLSLGAGVALAGVILCLSMLSGLSPVWLVLINQLAAGLLALPWAMAVPWPQGMQWFVLAVFGVVQVALPFWLMSHAIKIIPAHEAALITLLDPVLAPVWVFFLLGTVPAAATILGGGVFLAALIIRYMPAGVNRESEKAMN